MGGKHVTVDIEPTNRCNASCYFCPRDQTPHQGLMTPEIFERALARTVEYRTALARHNGAEVLVSLCGLGEPLLNKHVPDFVRRVREEGFFCSMSSNGALLDEARATRVLDAGVQQIYVNVGEEGDDYEEIYKLPFERTRENVVRFAEMARGRCEVVIVIVDHRRDEQHIAEMMEYWRGYGLRSFTTYEIINRGGALFVDHMEYEKYPELAQARAMLAHGDVKPVCAAPFVYLFVGYNGQYYLCCSDWKKEVPLGSVFDTSFEAITRDKLAYVESREPICKTCNLDPVNLLTEKLRAATAGEVDDSEPAGFARGIIDGSRAIYRGVEKFVPAGTEPRQGATRRRTIPVTAA